MVWYFPTNRPSLQCLSSKKFVCTDYPDLDQACPHAGSCFEKPREYEDSNPSGTVRGTWSASIFHRPLVKVDDRLPRSYSRQCDCERSVLRLESLRQ